MAYDFDRVIDRRNSSSLKWRVYDEDVLPMWVADMDFPSPEPVHQVLEECIRHGIYGYSIDLPELKEVICSRLKHQQNWDIDPRDVVLLPGLVTGLNVVSRAFANQGEGVLINTPVYPPFLTAPVYQERELQVSRQRFDLEEDQLVYQIDFDDFEQSIDESTRLFILCNPHNPTGRVYSKQELAKLVDICQKKDLVICSDEIHCDMVLDDKKHISIAALDPSIADRTVTLLAPSKTFNLPGLGCSIAIITNPQLRSCFQEAARGIVPHPNLLGMYAALAAYSDCEVWRQELLDYLRGNRQLVVDFISSRLNGIRTTQPEATYLAWLDCGEVDLGVEPARFFLSNARVAMNNGKDFGPGGEGFVRLNFGCPRATLMDALERMENALLTRVKS